MLFRKINSFLWAQWSERSFICFAQRSVFRKRSWLIDKQANYRSKNPNDFSEGVNYRSKIRGESSREANYHSKNRADQNNRCHENAGKFRRNIVSSEISSKSHEKPGISSKFVCITFAQYCRLCHFYIYTCLHFFSSIASFIWNTKK